MSEIDKIIEEIRESRRRMSAECGHDPARYIEMMKAYNEKFAEQVERYRREFKRRKPDSRRTP